MKYVHRTLVAAGLLGLLLSLFLPGSARAGDQSWQTTREYLNHMDQKYDPLKTEPGDVRRGTGFNAYQRYKWFIEKRLDPETGNVPEGARWNAFEQLQAMEAEYGTRSETWYSLGPVNVAGRCLAIETDPTDENTAYAGFASSGIWKTEDAGDTCSPG